METRASLQTYAVTSRSAFLTRTVTAKNEELEFTLDISHWLVVCIVHV